MRRLKSALQRKICQRLVYQQPENFRRNAILAPVLAVKPAQKRLHTAWTRSGLFRRLKNQICSVQSEANTGLSRAYKAQPGPITHARRPCQCRYVDHAG